MSIWKNNNKTPPELRKRLLAALEKFLSSWNPDKSNWHRNQQESPQRAVFYLPLKLPSQLRAAVVKFHGLNTWCSEQHVSNAACIKASWQATTGGSSKLTWISNLKHNSRRHIQGNGRWSTESLHKHIFTAPSLSRREWRWWADARGKGDRLIWIQWCNLDWVGHHDREINLCTRSEQFMLTGKCPKYSSTFQLQGYKVWCKMHIWGIAYIFLYYV